MLVHYRFQDPAVVLGSSQDAGSVLERSAPEKVEEDSSSPPGPATGQGRLSLGSTPPSGMIRRRSGGGAVMLVPGKTVWVDLVVPRGDSLWVDDVTTSSYWLGRTWADALQALGIAGTSIHEGPLSNRREAKQVCFAGLGPGEVTLGGRKVVGISQRRTSQGAIFQCVALIGEGAPLVLDGAAAVAGGSAADTHLVEDLASGALGELVKRKSISSAFVRSLMRAQSGGIGRVSETQLVEHLMKCLPRP